MKEWLLMVFVMQHFGSDVRVERVHVERMTKEACVSIVNNTLGVGTETVDGKPFEYPKMMCVGGSGNVYKNWVNKDDKD